MDLLGSILNSMDKPPSISEKQKEAIKSKKNAYANNTNRVNISIIFFLQSKNWSWKNDRMQKKKTFANSESKSKKKSTSSSKMIQKQNTNSNPWIKFLEALCKPCTIHMYSLLFIHNYI